MNQRIITSLLITFVVFFTQMRGVTMKNMGKSKQRSIRRHNINGNKNTYMVNNQNGKSSEYIGRNLGTSDGNPAGDANNAENNNNEIPSNNDTTKIIQKFAFPVLLILLCGTVVAIYFCVSNPCRNEEDLVILDIESTAAKNDKYKVGHNNIARSESSIVKSETREE